jgi:hypothetical protein
LRAAAGDKVTGRGVRSARKEQTVEDILREPVELINADLAAVAGGLLNGSFNIGSFNGNGSHNGNGNGSVDGNISIS